MLRDTLYKVITAAHEQGRIDVTMEINKDSPIFAGHFPGQPVLPGACMVQIMKETVEHALKHAIRLIKADHIKFLRMIDPADHALLHMDITYRVIDADNISISSTMSDAEAICFKFKGTFTRPLSK